MRAKVINSVGVCLLAFGLLFSYELSRTAVESIFVGAYTNDGLPWAWIAVAVAMVPVVGLYDRFVERARLVTVFAVASLIAGGLLALLLLARSAGLPGTPFLLYLWKDVHIVLLLEIVWTFANVVFELKTARWAYGLFLVVGSSAGITGGLVVGAVAEHWDTATSLWIPVTTLVLLSPLALALGRVMTDARPTERRKSSLADAIRLLRSSRYLPWLMLLVLLVQLVINLVDYTYLGAIQAAFPDEAERTGVMGQVNAAINVGALVMQVLAGPLLRLAGVPLILLAIPALLGAALAGFTVVPRFVLMGVAKVSSKALDYSLFKAGKEMLYIPLSYDEKTRGKAAIDMFTYRAAKGGASLLVLGLGVIGLGGEAIGLTLLLVVVWFLVTLRVVRRYRSLVSRERELRGG